MNVRMIITKGDRRVWAVVGCFLPEPVENAIADGWVVSLFQTDEPMSSSPEFQAIMGEIMDKAAGQVTHKVLDPFWVKNRWPDSALIHDKPAVQLSLGKIAAFAFKTAPDCWEIFQAYGSPNPTAREHERMQTYLKSIDMPEPTP